MTIGETFILICCGSDDRETFLSADRRLFRDAAEIKLYKYIRNYLTRKGEYPPLDLINAEVRAEYTLPRKGDAPSYLAQLKKANVRFTLSESLPGLMPVIKEDPWKAVNLLKDVLAGLDFETASTDTPFSKAALDRYEKYLRRKETDGVVYVSTGSPILDKLFFGYQKTDLVTVGGRPGVGKTWWLLNALMSLDRWLGQVLSGEITFVTALDLERPILFISNEMNEEELIDRLDCMKFLLSYQDFLSGNLSRRDECTYREGLKLLETIGSNIIVVYNCNSLDEVSAKIHYYNPLVTFIDGAYLLTKDIENLQPFDQTMRITRGLKAQAMTGCPIINTTQLRKTGKKGAADVFDSQNEFYYGSYIQDSDIAVRMYQTPDMLFNRLTGLEIAKGRRVPPMTKLFWECNTHSMTFNYLEDDFDETGLPPTFGEDSTPTW
jgi:hypothetical protein